MCWMFGYDPSPHSNNLHQTDNHHNWLWFSLYTARKCPWPVPRVKPSNESSDVAITKAMEIQSGIAVDEHLVAIISGRMVYHQNHEQTILPEINATKCSTKTITSTKLLQVSHHQITTLMDSIDGTGCDLQPEGKTPVTLPTRHVKPKRITRWPLAVVRKVTSRVWFQPCGTCITCTNTYIHTCIM